MAELDRRDFLKLAGAGAGAVATVGCSDPVEKLVPYVIQPETITPGIAVDYASTCQECAVRCGLHVKTREGRPIKLEGNPDHPVNQGALCARGQAGIQRTYHPDRYEGPLARQGDALAPTTWDAAIETLATKLREAGGRKVRVLGASRGPTLDGLVYGFLSNIGGYESQNIVYTPFGDDTLRKATGAVFGRESVPLFDLSKADLVLDFGSDFLDTGVSPVEHSRQFAEAQDVKKSENGGARLVSIGPRMNLTVSNADQWIAAAPGSEGTIALALAKATFDRVQAAGGVIAGDAGAIGRALSGASTAEAARVAGVDAAQIDALAARLAKAKAPVALPPGVAASSQRATAATAAVLLLNALIGAIGRSVQIPDAAPAAGANMAGVQALIADMNAGRVSVLVIHDANPLYSIPADAGFEAALQKVDLVVSTASMKDETSQAADLVLPDHAPLESWGDAAPRPGVRSIVQPTLRPLFDTRSLGDTLLAAGRAAGASGLPTGDFRSVVESAWADTNWREALSQGGVFGAEAAAGTAVVAASVGNIEFREPQFEGSGDHVVVAYPHSFLGDGSGAALGWMQETPDPVTKASWGSWAEISNATAERLGVGYGEVITISTGFGAGSIDVPVYPRGGVRDDVVAVAIGQGHRVGLYASYESDGQPGVARGASVLSVLPARTDESGGQAFLAAKASLSKQGSYFRVPISQWTDNQHERGLAPEVSLLALAKAGHGDDHGEDHHARGGFIGNQFEHGDMGMESPYLDANDASPDSAYRWGMVIDNDRCNGCSACVVACAVENNIPTVGQDGANRHREMTWIRIERYLGDGEQGKGGAERRPHPNGETLGEVNVRHVAMLCQHCGAAPCESVCPVIATYHTPEGLNGMVYNRCVGTRYCANNCTYKVRRFNYFDYSGENWPGLLSLGLNPDVTVRGQGVMEKCTFCVQRIEAARQPAKDEGRDIRDGEVVTACQQTCPSNAITFGNTKDPASAVIKKGEQPERAYRSLMVLNTRPAIKYLAQVNREEEKGSHG